MAAEQKKLREEKDTMGSVYVPDDAYYGAQTYRAQENFPISDLRLPSSFIRMLAMIKKHGARVNKQLKRIPGDHADAVDQAAQEVIAGNFNDQFIVDLFQTGSGTSTNMNLNEVIATRANEILTGKRSVKTPVHPNDTVNLGQSSNDVIPTAIHMSAAEGIHRKLKPALTRLHRALNDKSVAFREITKVGRTHLQDAVPMTLGQEFSGYARQIEQAIERIESVYPRLTELALGGTAVGNGLNAHPEFASLVIKQIAEETGISFSEAANHFSAQGSQDTAVELSGVLKSLAVSLLKIANDLRLLASGPKCGLGEINLPSLQPGSSIMPGKVNPVIPEAVVQVAAQVVGNDATITMGGQWGMLELNVMLPVIAYNLIQSIELLSNASWAFADKCIDGITVNRERCLQYVKQSSALVTYLIPHIGYDKAAAVAKQSEQTGKSVPELVREEGVVSNEVFKELFGDLV